MLTKIRIRNFKRFDDVEIELGQTVVFIGPNNSGKTTTLQALALWYLAFQNLQSFMLDDMRILPPFVMNRLDLLASPVPSAQMLWRDLHVQNGGNIHIEIILSGVTSGNNWDFPFSFVFSNDESISCAAITFPKTGTWQPQEEVRLIPSNLRINFLPPMSGLASVEPRIEQGRINVLIGEGRTAEVLRNLCLLLYEANGKSGYWDRLVSQILEQFGAELLPPKYISARGEIRMSYKERSGITLDLSAAGRGMLQILLLLAYMYNNPGAVLLLDEPDAHLEILRQREIYQLLTTVAQEQNSQIIAATHSEVIMNEAADRDIVVAFVGKPHRIDDRSHQVQVAKSLKSIGFEDYYQAEQTGWVLYLEGSTDLAILRGFAHTLKHAATGVLEAPFVRYVSNRPTKVREHYQGLREAKPDLVGIAIFDRLGARQLQKNPQLQEIMWRRREIENYLAMPEALHAYARHGDGDAERRVQIMRRLITRRIPPAALEDRSDPFWINTKMSDDFLDLIFEQYFKELGLPNLLRKTDYHVLANFVPAELIDPEVTEKLNAIVAVAKNAKPRED